MENSVIEGLEPKAEHSLANTQDQPREEGSQAAVSKSMLDKTIDRRTAVGEIVVNSPKGGAEFGLNGKLFCRIAVWWVATVPVAFGVAAIIELIAK